MVEAEQIPMQQEAWEKKLVWENVRITLFFKLIKCFSMDRDLFNFYGNMRDNLYLKKNL